MEKERANNKEILDKDAIHNTLEEYKKFAFKDDMIKLAIAFVLGGAFQKVVNAISESLIMPLLNYLVLKTGTGWREHTFEPVPGMKFATGVFLGAVVDFLLISIVLFVVFKIFKGTIIRERNEPSLADKIKSFVLGDWFYPVAICFCLLVSFTSGWTAGIWTLMAFSMVAVWIQNRQWRMERRKREELEHKHKELEKSVNNNETRQNQKSSESTQI